LNQEFPPDVSLLGVRAADLSPDRFRS